MRGLSILVGFIAVGIASSEAAPEPTPLLGELIQNTYHSPNQAYSITVPISLDVGGTVTDTPQVVTFQDEFNLHASIACFDVDTAQNREDQARGRRDYLIWFYRQQVHPQFQKRFEGASIDSARFVPEMLHGSLIVYSRLPAGSMFEDRLDFSLVETTTEAIRGNMLFVESGHLYVVSLELAKLLLNPESRALPLDEQQDLLRKQLLDIVGRMTFRSSAKSAS
jgi:hypothetical protein